MKRNYTLNLYYGVCFGIVLAIFPVKNNSATIIKDSRCKQTQKLAKADKQENIEILHSDLLFR